MKKLPVVMLSAALLNLGVNNRVLRSKKNFSKDSLHHIFGSELK